MTPSLPEQTAPERSSEETHRIVTVLFADVSVRQEASQTPSPEGIAPTLRDFAREAGDIIARHGGELHSLVGGCLVAVFGVAGAHESDPERALRAALEARAAAGRLGLDLSAGLSTGDVLFAKVEAGGWSRAALLGAPADAARRLSGNAAPGEILAGEATYRLAARAFEFARLDRDLGTGAAYRVEHPLLERGRDMGREGYAADLIGRDAELRAPRDGHRRASPGAGRDGVDHRRGGGGQVAADPRAAHPGGRGQSR